MNLSIIIPVFNEEKTIAQVIKKIEKLTLPGVIKEIVIINDGSTDSTHAVITKSIKAKKNISYLQHEKNLGKGAAVLKGIKKAKGEYIAIQDADLEYDPLFFKELIKPILEKKAEVVYGTRLKRLPHFRDEERSVRFIIHYFGNRGLSLLVSLMYWQWVTDMETCYKIFPKAVLKGKTLKARGFEFEPEITAVILKSTYKFVEIPIRTTPRGYADGKKLHTVKDGWKALKTVVSNRFIS